MKKSKTRLKIVLVGFLVFFIPLFLFGYCLQRIYFSTKARFKESLKEKVLSSVTIIKENLKPYNYLKNEISKIHRFLLPDFQEEVTDKTPDDEFVKSLYTKELFDKLVSLTKDRFEPILITLGTNNLDKFFAYYSPELEAQLNGNYSERKQLKENKYLLDKNELIEKYNVYFGTVKGRYPDNKAGKDRSYFYKYLTRYYKYELFPILPNYTDYYGKQNIYNIVKYSFSKKGIHGYYSLIIPQRIIDPMSILNNLEEKDGINIEITDKQKEKTLFKENEYGVEYCLNFTPEFINQIEVYKSFGGTDRGYLLEKQLKITANYSPELYNLKTINYIAEILTVLLIVFYFFISIVFLRGKTPLIVSITNKIISILSIILCLPIMGVAFITFLSAHNLDNVIDYNVAQNLHNKLEDFYVKNLENNSRRIASVFEVKRRFLKSKIEPKSEYISNNFLSNKETKSWFSQWNAKFYVYSGQCFKMYDEGKIVYQININKQEKFNSWILEKYYNNLGLATNNKKSKKEEYNNLFGISVLSDYISPKLEERTAGQESIPNSDVFKLKDTYTSIYYYAKDSQNKNYLFLSKNHAEKEESYTYIDLMIEKNPLIFQPYHDFSEINFGIKLNNYSKIELIWPKNQIIKDSLKEKLNNMTILKDSGHEIIKQKNGSLIKEWIFTMADPFLIAGEAKSHYNYKVYFVIYLIFPLLLTYAVLLLVMLMGFISVFIKKPIKIYKEAIQKLSNNNYGLTIESFSKDEFDYITKAFNEMSVAIKQKEQIGRYVSSKLIESVKENEVQIVGNGKQEKVTILSSDIRNFTGISEMYEPSIIVEMLNSYFTNMQQAISTNGGIIDKYIGDAIQAVFYDEPNKENQVLRASRAAIAMRRALVVFNDERKKQGLFTIENGIGIDTDIAITGTIGTNDGRKDFSVNGDVIDRAAELEAKTKLTQSKILISKKSLDEIPITPLPSNLHPNIEYKYFDEVSVELINVK